VSAEGKEIPEIMWKIVRARVSTMSPNIRVSVGGVGTMGREELIGHIDKRDQIGMILLRAHVNYIKSFKEEAKIFQ